jgi:hypothetical protein
MKLKKYTEKELRDAVKSSCSLRQTLIKLNIKPAGGNYETLKKAINFFSIDTNHFKGKSSNRGRKFGPRRDIDDYLSNKFPIQSNKLRKRLLKEKIFQHICSKCNLKEWNGKPIPLELDHINGNNQDNSLCNLRLLCPNCHAQTPNYRGKNIGKSKS